MQLNNFIRFTALVLFTAMLLLLFIGGSQPVAVNLFPAPWDKLVHCITFGAMLIIASLAFPKIKPAYLLVIIITIGALDEIHQIYLPGRSPGFDDLAADLAGGLLAVVLIKIFMHFKTK